MEARESSFQSALLRSAEDAVVGVSPEGTVVTWSTGAERIYGYTAAEILGTSVDRLVPVELRAEEAHTRDRLLRGEQLGRYDSTRLTRDDRRLRFSVSPFAVRDENGAVLGTAEFARDVTDRRKRDAEIRRLYVAARELSRTLDLHDLCRAFRELAMDAISCDGIIVSQFDAARTEIRCAYAWTGSVEVAPATLLPISYDPELPGMQTEVIRTAESRIFNVGERVAQPGGNYIEVHLDGTRSDLKAENAAPPTARSAMMSPIKLDGRVLGVVQVMSHRLDAYGPEELETFEGLISPLAVAFQNAALFETIQQELRERRAAEEALRKGEERYRDLAAELEERVAQRTEALQRAVDELTGFSYSISHDMRAPIRAIIASSRILLDEYAVDLADDASAELRRQATAAQKLGALVDDLLQYARLGHREPAHREVDLTNLAREAAERLARPGWPCEGARFEIADGMVAKGDAPMLEILLTILLENSGKYRRPGVAPTIKIGADSEGYFVADDGIGFDMKFIGKLFRPFERLHRDEEYPGTGIGLANAKRIVERHGGAIWAESPGVGKGACFRFRLR